MEVVGGVDNYGSGMAVGDVGGVVGEYNCCGSTFCNMHTFLRQIHKYIQHKTVIEIEWFR